jgi:hypothetical protein
MAELIHTFSTIFSDDKITRSLTQFSEAPLRELEKSLFDKNGKPFVKCLATGKERQAKPEEIVRQLWIQRLLTHYSYPVSRLAIEYPITFGRDTSKRGNKGDRLLFRSRFLLRILRTVSKSSLSPFPPLFLLAGGNLRAQDSGSRKRDGMRSLSFVCAAHTGRR